MIPIRLFQLAVLGTALIISGAGGVVLVDYLSDTQRNTATVSATLDGLAAQVGPAEWSMADHVMPIPGQGGYQMPPQMMPGMPTGDDARLSVPLTLRNTSGRGLTFDLVQEFVLRGGSESKPRELVSDTFGDLDRLGAGSGVNGVLFFDAKAPGPNEPPLYLEWIRSGDTVQLSVLLDGASPPEHHK